MNLPPSNETGDTAAWEQDIRVREEEARVAFLAANVEALDELLTSDFAVNSPLQRIHLKPLLLQLVGSGRIRHLESELEIEHMSRYGDVVVVMGRDSVVDPPDGVRSHRRYTNLWRLEGDVWRLFARHAHIVSREVAP